MTRLTLGSLALAAAIVALVSSVPAAAGQRQEPTLYAIGSTMVLEYPQNGSDQLPSDVLGTSSGLVLPNGVATDRRGNVWVATSGQHSSDIAIMAFAPGAKRAFFTIPNTYADMLTLSPDGTLAAEIVVGGKLEVAVYPPGATAPSRVIPVPPQGLLGLALDANDDVYLSIVLGPNRRRIVKVLHGGRFQGLGIKLVIPGAIAIRPDGSLVAIDLERRTLETFPPGATKPSHEITIPALFTSTNGAFAFNAAGDRVYVAAGGGMSGGPGAIFEFDYATGRVVKTITGGFPAVNPPPSLATSP